jgi:hypothetical protein
MTSYYLDASAWVKRHQNEAGSTWMNRVWTPQRHFACASLGLIEVLCTVARRHASQGLPESRTRAALQRIRTDFDSFSRIELDAAVLRLAESLAVRHRLRGADCVHLASALHLRTVQREPVTLIASDAELLAAAAVEGLPVLDPATDPALPET